MDKFISAETIRLSLLLLTAIVSLVNNWQGRIIHTLVNSKMTTALKRIDELEEELKKLREKTI